MAYKYEDDNPSNCNCLENTFTDLKTVYVRGFRKSELDLKEFATHWERTQTVHKDCTHFCKLVGISISKCADDKSRIKILEYWTQVYRNSPGWIKHLCFFKFKENAGLIKDSPSKDDGVVYHHTFYKDEKFIIDQIEVETIEDLKKYA